VLNVTSTSGSPPLNLSLTTSSVTLRLALLNGTYDYTAWAVVDGSTIHISGTVTIVAPGRPVTVFVPL